MNETTNNPWHVERGLVDSFQQTLMGLGFNTATQQMVGAATAPGWGSLLQRLRAPARRPRSVLPGPRADIVAEGREGETVVVEVKAGRQGDSLSVNAIAQAKGIAESVAALGRRVVPIIYTNLDVSNASYDAARALQVNILRAGDDNTVARQNLIDTLKALNISIPSQPQSM